MPRGMLRAALLLLPLLVEAQPLVPLAAGELAVLRELVPLCRRPLDYALLVAQLELRLLLRLLLPRGARDHEGLLATRGVDLAASSLGHALLVREVHDGRQPLEPLEQLLVLGRALEERDDILLTVSLLEHDAPPGVLSKRVELRIGIHRATEATEHRDACRELGRGHIVGGGVASSAGLSRRHANTARRRGGDEVACFVINTPI